ncbi:MAG: 50S ribosomal protein L24 [Paracholeplasma sp.]|jgi:large subunit ribosomal protein L24|uniref:Large ribosomal subunit protein uL24 n=1 Tax=Acholeplasma brassicae TaxID=61635 RepID=U4KMB9_9MOLU|nr:MULTISPECIES: 50S ribosomal protein L24 [Paracholeplasma]MDY3196079.1 50S ribosomal protein L24 [Paracholeplasma sp.]CCV65267.1 50S ribosomal protein L24 [Paracholeplasma brassicae]HBT59354.1 50S ribosomal protein L24 [Acholeplasmataceae bacterium]
MNIKSGDTVVVIAGKDKFTVDKKGKKVQTTGKVIKAFPNEQKVLVEGVNKVKKHQRPTQQNEKGSIVEQEAPIHVSNVMILDPKKGVPTRVGYKMVDGKKVRYAKKSGDSLDK